jgi:chromosome segregation ATPase
MATSEDLTKNQVSVIQRELEVKDSQLKGIQAELAALKLKHSKLAEFEHVVLRYQEIQAKIGPTKKVEMIPADDITEFRRKIDDAKLLAEKQQKDLIAKEDACKQLQQENDALKRAMRDHQNDLKAKIDEIAAIRAKTKDLENSLDAKKGAESRADNLSDEIRRLKQEIDSQLARYKDLSSKQKYSTFCAP